MNQVTFGASYGYFMGSGGRTSPTISMNNQYIVEAHILQTKIYTTLAPLTGKPDISFSSGISASSNNSVNARSVSVALLSNQTVILTYANSDGYLFYRIGTITQALTINWLINDTALPTIIRGGNCCVAANDNGKVLLVSEFQSKLYYIYGPLIFSTNFIDWQQTYNYDSGVAPSIAINNNDDFIEVHQSENHNSIYYKTGYLSNNQIHVQHHDEYKGDLYGTPSVTPSVAMNSAGLVLEVHASGGTNDSLYYMQFQFNSSTKALNLQHEQRYSIKANQDGMGGKNPVVAFNNNGDAFQLYQTDSGDLYGCLSKIWDRSNWMSSFRTKTLGQLSIPGSHDAGMSKAQYKTLWASEGNTVTQIMTIANQLERGIRYFDLRPAYVSGSSSGGNNIYTGHYSWAEGVTIQGACGEKMYDILQGVKQFIDVHNTEVVILKFSHFYSAVSPDYFFSDSYVTATQKQSKIDSLIDLITSTLGTSVYTKPINSNIRLTNTLLSSCAGKVIIVFDVANLNGVTLKSSNIYHYLDYNPETPNASSADLVVFDKYTNTNDLSQMTSHDTPQPYLATNKDMTQPHPGQFYLLKNTLDHGGDLFLLSWTLTLQWDQLENPAAYNILQLSQLATAVLAHQMIQFQSSLINYFPNIIYVDAADGFVTDVCVWINNLQLK